MSSSESWESKAIFLLGLSLCENLLWDHCVQVQLHSDQYCQSNNKRLIVAAHQSIGRMS